MKKRGFIVIAMLLVTSLMAALGSGALNVFSAKRSAAMQVVTDSNALVSLAGDNKYAVEQSNGTLKLDFTNGTAFTGKGFNPQANSEFNNVFTVTNKSPNTIYVWLESPEFQTKTQIFGLEYRIEATTGKITSVDEWIGAKDWGLDLLSGKATNYVDGVGQQAYVELDPGENFTVKMLVNTVQANGYGDANSVYSDWSHTVIVKANTTKPTQKGIYNH